MYKTVLCSMTIWISRQNLANPWQTSSNSKDHGAIKSRCPGWEVEKPAPSAMGQVQFCVRDLEILSIIICIYVWYIIVYIICRIGSDFLFKRWWSSTWKKWMKGSLTHKAMAQHGRSFPTHVTPWVVLSLDRHFLRLLSAACGCMIQVWHVESANHTRQSFLFM